MATSSSKSELKGFCMVKLVINGTEYPAFRLYVLSDLCADVILGQDWQSLHESVTIKYGGAAPSVEVCGLTTLSIEPVSLF